MSPFFYNYINLCFPQPLVSSLANDRATLEIVRCVSPMLEPNGAMNPFPFELHALLMLKERFQLLKRAATFSLRFHRACTGVGQIYVGMSNDSSLCYAPAAPFVEC